jgi:hypothetical protein
VQRTRTRRRERRHCALDRRHDRHDRPGAHRSVVDMRIDLEKLRCPPTVPRFSQEFTVKRLIPAMNAVQMELRKKGEFFFPENMRTGWIFPFHALCRKSLYSARPHY